MLFKWLKSTLFIIFTLLLLNPAHAVIIDNGHFTTDSQSGLDWLDVTESFQRSYDDVSSQFGAGGDFEGWRYATLNELIILINNATGISIGESQYYQYLEVPEDTIDTLVAYLGSTLDLYWPSVHGDTGSWDSNHGFEEGEGLDETAGMLANINDNNSPMYAHFIDKDYDPNRKDLIFINTESTLTRYNVEYIEVGSFLVRQSQVVPEPSILWLFSFSLVGFILFRRKNRIIA